MPLLPKILDALAWASRACGFETVSSFPARHRYARTRWNPAYFDIASDLNPVAIERSMCESISNTPSVVAYIVNPTPGMQRALRALQLGKAAGNGADELSLSSFGVELARMLVDAARACGAGKHHAKNVSDRF